MEKNSKTKRALDPEPEFPLTSGNMQLRLDRLENAIATEIFDITKQECKNMAKPEVLRVMAIYSLIMDQLLQGMIRGKAKSLNILSGQYD